MIGINVGFIIWILLWSNIDKTSKAIIPLPAMFLSLFVAVLFLILVKSKQDFVYAVIDFVKDEEIDSVELLPIVIEDAFVSNEIADISFEDSINIFINDVDELDDLGFHPAIYQESEDLRIANVIETEISKFNYVPISGVESFSSGSLVDRSDELDELLGLIDEQFKM